MDPWMDGDGIMSSGWRWLIESGHLRPQSWPLVTNGSTELQKDHTISSAIYPNITSSIAMPDQIVILRCLR